MVRDSHGHLSILRRAAAADRNPFSFAGAVVLLPPNVLKLHRHVLPYRNGTLLLLRPDGRRTVPVILAL